MIGLLFALTVPAGAAAEDADLRFTGTYVMKGKGFSANDRPYAGTCTLAAEGPVYRVSCFNADTRHTYVGKGLAIGDTLAIMIGDELRGDHGSVYAGEYLVIYRRAAGGALEGIWVHAGSPAAGAETLQPKP
jgi:hypothetical protein